ncbi:putative endonuclease [Sulfurimonas gotlandica GD1]|jgi:phosphatidylserine/phosphatidylglycerophosphate/cardiolipin synthase-like enzyme|uniref:phospholipase D n=1 Tax=Sulfurimonas gotlandica (strain DSM 19862 / JCM 16533 / GD1) TaxID=929558 RepID=B6BI69_SULGG|nr:phospholipase D-like domain-containing protein [Sulfurimonas gotlandica]EDZ62899.1 membrane bound endonuclease, putative [Sulfurimonas gotlandica GD1]EHP30221.1 putative endonuclease [Sulfurimonas gotlandica GD1]
MKLFFILLLSINIYAQNTLYFFPQDSLEATKDIEKLITNSKENIDIAMYNFGHKKFAKLLNEAQKRGVNVNVFYDKKDVDFKDIKSKKVDKKLHTKIAIFDKRIVVFGSPNWTKKSFNNNYEVLYITDDKKLVSKFNEFFKTLD